MATELSLEEMKQLVKHHFEDFVNKRKAAVIHKNITPHFHDDDGPGGKPTGVAGDERMMIGMYKDMPDLRLTIEEITAEGDKWCAATFGAGPTSQPARRSMVLYSGVSKGTKLRNAGQQ